MARLVPYAALMCSLLLLPGLALVSGGLVVSLFRTSIKPSTLLPSSAGYMLVLVGLVGLGYLLSRGGLRRLGLERIAPVIVFVELVGVVAALVIKLTGSISGLAILMLSIERGLWFSIGVAVLFLMPLSAIIALLKAYLMPLSSATSGVAGYRGSLDHYLGEALLILALLVGVTTPVIVHLPVINPALSVVSTDTPQNVGFVEEIRREGLVGGILGLAGWLRPLYMMFVYAISSLIPLDPRIIFDVVVPALGYAAIALTVYWVMGPIAPPRTRGVASLLSVLYWSPAFTYAGFQTNLLALPLALAATRLLWDGRLKLFTIASTALGLWHPWTFTYYALSWLLYTVMSKRANPDKPIGGITASIAVAALTAILIQALILYVSRINGYTALRGFTNTLTMSIGIGPLLFSYYEYTWGTMARPEIQIPAIIALARGLDPRLLSIIAPAFIAYPLLNPVSAYRILLITPAPLAAAIALKPGSPGEVVVMVASLAAWLILVVNSPPAFTLIPWQ